MPNLLLKFKEIMQSLFFFSIPSISQCVGIIVRDCGSASFVGLYCVVDPLKIFYENNLIFMRITQKQNIDFQLRLKQSSFLMPNNLPSFAICFIRKQTSLRRRKQRKVKQAKKFLALNKVLEKKCKDKGITFRRVFGHNRKKQKQEIVLLRRPSVLVTHAKIFFFEELICQWPTGNELKPLDSFGLIFFIVGQHLVLVIFQEIFEKL